MLELLRKMRPFTSPASMRRGLPRSVFTTAAAMSSGMARSRAKWLSVPSGITPSVLAVPASTPATVLTVPSPPAATTSFAPVAMARLASAPSSAPLATWIAGSTLAAR